MEKQFVVNTCVHASPSIWSAPKLQIRRTDRAALIPRPKTRSDAKCIGPPRSPPARDEQRRCDPRRPADRAADHDPQAALLRSRRQSEHLSQPTRFVEPDIEANKASASASFNDRN